MSNKTTLLVGMVCLLITGYALAQETVDEWKAGAFWYGWYDWCSCEPHDIWDQKSLKVLPSKGKYSSQDTAILNAQVVEGRTNKIKVFAAEWYFTKKDDDCNPDTPRIEYYTDPEVHALEQALQNDKNCNSYPNECVRFLIFYDQMISLFYHCPALEEQDFVNFNIDNDNKRACINNNFRVDYQHIKSQFFTGNSPNSPNYLKFRSTKAGIFIYASRAWQGEVGCSEPCSYHQAVTDLRNHYSGNIYLIGDEVWRSSYVDQRIDELDAVSAYGIGGVEIPDLVHTAYVADVSITVQENWKNHVSTMHNQYTSEIINFMPATMPNFEDDHQIERPKVGDFNDDNGTGFGYFLKKAKDLAPIADGNAKFVWINSFNEWWETSSIEPSASTPLVSCSAPNNCFRYAWQDIFLKEVNKIFGQSPGPAPTISSFQRKAFGTKEKPTFEVTGSNFISATTPKTWLSFLPLSASNVNVVSSSSLSITAPAWEGRDMYSIPQAINADGQRSSNTTMVRFVPYQLEWYAPPIICPNKDFNIEVRVANVLEGFPENHEKYYIKSIRLSLNLPACFTCASPPCSPKTLTVWEYRNASASWTIHSSSTPECTPNNIIVTADQVQYCWREDIQNPPPDYIEQCWWNTGNTDPALNFTPVPLTKNVRIKNPTFGDVDCNNIFYGYIERLYELGITSGCSADPLLYCPNDPVTRAQMAKFVTNARGDTRLEMPPYYPSCISQFKDVEDSNMFCPYIENIKNQGLVMRSCTSQPNYFCPTSNILRKDMAVWTTLGIGLRPGELFWGKFNDVYESAEMNSEMCRLIEKGNVVAIYVWMPNFSAFILSECYCYQTDHGKVYLQCLGFIILDRENGDMI